MSSCPICIVILCLVAAFTTHNVQGKPQIVKPFPDNLHAIEDEKAQVSCTVKDTEGKNPTKILFYRKSKYGDTDLIPHEGVNGRIHYENITSDGGKTLKVTLHFNKVDTSDDSYFGGYECHGFVGVEHEPYGFTVNVIKRNELPGISVSNNKTVKFGDSIVVSCNLTTKPQHSTKLRKIMWKKDGEVIDEVLYPREQSLKSREFEVLYPSDGGVYSCDLISKLRGVKDYNVSGTVVVTVEPKFFTEELLDNEIKIFKEEKARFVCSAKGNPLKTEWKKKLKSDSSPSVFDVAAKSSKYEFSNLDKLEGHTLTIKDTTYEDRGMYYCCIVTNTTRDEDDVKGCQAYTLRVKDPLGALWPVIGIIVEVILLILIIVLSEMYKKKKSDSNKTDGRVEFSYSSTDDIQDKGQVRLRPTAAAAASSGEKA